jgi:hypothetical protein
MLPKTDIWLLFVRIGDIGDTLHPTRSLRLGRKLLIDRNSITERDEFPLSRVTPPAAQDRRLALVWAR